MDQKIEMTDNMIGFSTLAHSWMWLCPKDNEWVHELHECPKCKLTREGYLLKNKEKEEGIAAVQKIFDEDKTILYISEKLVWFLKEERDAGIDKTPLQVAELHFEKMGVSKEKLKKVIAHLKRMGDIYEPSFGYLRST
jgi:hypothetical protein